MNLALLGDGTFDVMLPYLLSVWSLDGFHVGQEELEEAAACPHSTLFGLVTGCVGSFKTLLTNK